ncbi:unnamed protein product [Lactuca virosa]|uniref:HAT C-terminal dimerisation domain-containing protein n=1 Tax=Lactuca virosa TaxID=75947 RepID=A0AAU9PR17_9ASTR|nr:unnamed protein product [Lactuca virosa]
MASQEQETQSQGSSSTIDQPPLWDYVTKLEKLVGAEGCWKFKCNLCSETRQGSYSRVRTRLFGIKGTGISICKKATTTDKVNMKRLEDAYKQKKVESQEKEVELPCEADIGFKKRKGISTPIERAFGVEIRDQLDQEIARTFYTRGNGPLFLKALNCFEEVKDRFYIAELMKEFINEIGHQIVVQIITDNAANCKVAGEIIEMARWAKNNTPLHCLANSLHPRYYSDAWLLEDSTRCAPHRDGEISQERMKCFRRLFPNDDEYNKVLDEYVMLSIKSGPFEDLTSISKIPTMEPKNWWVNFGAQTPFLQTLAFGLLGQPSSSSCAERNWSTYAFIHSLKMNKLTTSRA